MYVPSIRICVQRLVVVSSLFILQSCTTFDTWNDERYDRRYEADKAAFEKAKIAQEQARKNKIADSRKEQSSSTLVLLSLFEDKQYQESLDYVEYLYGRALIDITKEAALLTEIYGLVDSAKHETVEHRVLEGRLNGLIKKWPYNEFAHLLNGFFLNSWAFSERGDKTVDAIPQEQLAAASRLWERARTAFRTAKNIKPDNYLSYIGLSSLGNPRVTMVDMALDKQPGSFWAHHRKMWMLQPQWVGSVELQEQALVNAKLHIQNKSQIARLEKLLASGKRAAARRKR